MEIHTTDNPAKLLGEELSERINTHDGDVVCLLSGGSALDVIQYIELGEERQDPNKCECRTIFMMGDERWSREREVNNTLQLQTRYLEHLVNKTLIATIPDENESLVDFAARIEKTFLEKLSQLRNVKIFMILGMGSDGHTAGIFPMSKGSFQKTYRDDTTYVPVHVEGLKIDSRASFTPAWILRQVDEIFAYVVGDAKHLILKSLINETKELHERPAELLKLHKHSHIYTDQALEPK
ncbi:MAG: 6-phosphogluconolactonase [Candidatus Pacebacteria bacterium]|nr:6-phosphogluconolactonase [Candidatus Paceibacterota bacterium]